MRKGPEEEGFPGGWQVGAKPQEPAASRDGGGWLRLELAVRPCPCPARLPGRTLCSVAPQVLGLGGRTRWGLLDELQPSEGGSSD